MGKFFDVFGPANAIAVLVWEVAILYGCYLTGVFLDARIFEGPIFAKTFLFQDNGLLRIALVVATIISFNRLNNNFQFKSRTQLVQQVCLSVGVAFLTQALVAYLLSGWILPRYTMIMGSMIVLIAIPLFREVLIKIDKRSY